MKKIFAINVVSNLVFIGSYLVHNIHSTLKRKTEKNTIEKLKKPIEVFMPPKKQHTFFAPKGTQHNAFYNKKASKPMGSPF